MIVRVPKDRQPEVLPFYRRQRYEDRRKYFYTMFQRRKTVFHTRRKPDYSSLVNFMSEDVIPKEK